MLILNPHSSFAIARGKSLRVNPLGEINKAILKLRRALGNVHEGPGRRLALQNEEDIHSSEFLSQQLDQLKAERRGVNLSVRFYEVMTETPIYIISNFAAKGLIIDQHSAAYNPWMVFLDNPHQSGDIFDCLKKSFDTIWEGSSTECPLVPSPSQSIPLDKNKVFLSQAHNSSVAGIVRELIERHLALQVVVYTDSALIGKGPFENLEAMVSQCGYAVIVLTKDDQVIGRTTVSVQEDSPRGRKRGRQNVIHEIGYCQGRMGVERVLILFEDGVEIPSNIAYLHGQPIKSGNIEDVYRFLAKHLKKKCNNP
jgi:predicted nucleotide-binding protein